MKETFKLFNTLKLKNMQCKNRIMRSATWEALSDNKGYLSDHQYQIYEELAANDVGIICTGYARIDKDEYPNAGMMGIYDDSFIIQYQKLTQLIHKYGSMCMMQIAYGGTKTSYEVEGRQIFSPSAVPERSTGIAGTPMTKENIKHLVDQYADAAKRIKKSGFDAVEIHGGHSYLLNQFLSPYYNRRSDEYGGSTENRYRIIDEIIKAIRISVGENYPIWIKITCSDFFEGGMTFAESLEICKKLEQTGVDVIEVSGNIHGKAQQMIGQSFDNYHIDDGGYFYEYAKEIAEAVNIPVFATGGFSDPQKMEKMLENSKLCGFGLSRPLLCEPNLIRRWKSGDLSRAKCVHCSKCRTPEGNYCTVFNKK